MPKLFDFSPLGELKYTEKSTAPCYTSSQTGQINFSRLVHGYSDYWESPSSTIVHKKKTLILADWSAADWSDEEEQAFFLLFSYLLQQEFVVYVWQKNGLVKLHTASMVLDKSLQSNIVPEFKCNILAGVMQDYNLTPHQVMILYRYQLMRLLGCPEEELCPIEIKATRSKTKQELDRIAEIQQQDAFSSLVRHKTSSLPRLQTLMLSHENIDQMMTSSALPLVALRDSIFKEPNGFTVRLMGEATSTPAKHVTLTNEKDFTLLPIGFFNWLFEVSALSNQVEHLHLTRVDCKGDLASFMDGSLQSLQLEDVHITASLLARLLRGCKSLFIKSVILEVDTDEVFSFPQLISVQQAPNADETGVIGWLGKQNLNLQELRANSLLSLSGISFPRLEVFELHLDSESDICSKELTSILERCPSIRVFKTNFAQSLDFNVALCSVLNRIAKVKLVCFYAYNDPPGDSDSDSNDESDDESMDNVSDYGDWGRLLRVDELMICDDDEHWFPEERRHFKALLKSIESVKYMRLYNEHSNFERLIDYDYPQSVEHVCFVGNGIRYEDLLSMASNFENLKSLMFYPTDAWTKILYLDEEEQSQWVNAKKDPDFTQLMQSLEYFSLPDEYMHANRNPMLLKRKRDDLSDVESDVESDDYATHAKRRRRDLSIDADTKLDENKHYDLTRIFYLHDQVMPMLPAPSSYRLKVHNGLSIQEGTQPFLLHNEDDLMLTADGVPQFLPQDQDVSTIVVLHDKLWRYAARQRLHLDAEWQPIASLDPQEWLYAIKCTPQDDVEIKYSGRDNLYYVKSSKEEWVTLDFIVCGDNTLCLDPLDPEIILLINDFRAFGEAALDLDSQESIYRFSNASLNDNLKQQPFANPYLDAILKQRVGSCRHRAVAFFAIINRFYPQWLVRIIENDCHMFVELLSNGKWIICDLGGYPAHVTIHDVVSSHEESIQSEDDESPPKIGVSVDSQQPLFERKLETWHTDTEQAITNCNEYVDWLLSQPYPCHLIRLPVKQALPLAMALQTHQDRARPVFYIHSPDDLVCAGPFIQRQGTRGVLCQQSGGALYDFLSASLQNDALQPILIVNYNHFLLSDFARFNTLIDAVEYRHVDHTPLSPRVRVLGLIDPLRPGVYDGADFYSRFSFISTCPIALSPMPSPLVAITDEQALSSEMSRINLCHSPAWLSMLMGGWVADEHGLLFQPGELPAALAVNRPIVIENPPADEAFELFWHKAFLHGYIDAHGERICLSSNLCMYTRENYDWSKELLRVTWSGVPSAHAFVLNPSLLTHFLMQYQTTEDQRITSAPGILAQHVAVTPDQKLAVLLTRSLHEDEWGLFFKEFACYPALSLQITCADGVTLPRAFSIQPEVFSEPLVKPYAGLIGEIAPQGICLDISECTASDLLMRMTITVTAEGIQAQETEKFLPRALRAGKTVLLTGRFSDELLDHLAPFLLARLFQSNPQGQLYFINQDTLQINPSFQHEEQGQLGRMDMPEFIMESSEADADTFMQARRAQVLGRLNETPYVFLTGLTGVGKSRFVDHEMQAHQIFKGASMNTQRDWARARSSDTTVWQVLFIDEANLSSRQWSEFEGLFQEFPGMLMDGEYFELTSQHKVIFAGNPLRYGERQWAPLFQRHGGFVNFTPLSAAVVYVKTIKPILQAGGIDNPAEMQIIASSVLAVYNHLMRLSSMDVLISPRQIQMMLMFILADRARYPDIDLLRLAQYQAQRLAVDLVPERHRPEFLQVFPAIDRKLLFVQQSVLSEQYIQTSSGEQVLFDLSDFLHVREYQVKLAKGHALCYLGLNRFIIEGEPGLGKSYMVTELLRAYDLNEGDAWHRLLPSWSVDKQKELLYQAFDAGAIVVIDEINCMPFFEDILNQLLEGYHPEEGNRPPHRAGFKVIGTQNPAHYAGRQLESPALSNRSIKRCMMPYTNDEIKLVLRQKFSSLKEQTLEDLVNAYQAKRMEARQKHRQPAPSFRDLLAVAAQENEAIMDESLDDFLFSMGEQMDIEMAGTASYPNYPVGFFSPLVFDVPTKGIMPARSVPGGYEGGLADHCQVNQSRAGR